MSVIQGLILVEQIKRDLKWKLKITITSNSDKAINRSVKH